MPSPKSGKAGSAVGPAEPKAADQADKADPGEVEKVKAEQRKTKAGKYGSVKVDPHKPPQTAEAKSKKPSWIEIELLDAQNQPVSGEKYLIKLPDKSVVEGVLDAKGFARLNGIEAGTCEVTFPELDGRSWAKE